MTKVKDIVVVFDEVAPFDYQESYDNSGLLCGNPEMEVKGVLVALDCIESIVDEAIASGANVVVAHHPILFSGIKRLTGANYVERTLIKAIENKIALIAVHTNLDNYRYGVNHVIAHKIGLINQAILCPKDATLRKLIVHVPTSHTGSLREAFGNAGFGSIGAYSNCSFTSSGEGRFQPNDGSSPFTGNINELAVVAEDKIEFIVQQHELKAAISLMKTVHPYEEIAYDIVPLLNKNETVGSGMVGELPEAIDCLTFLHEIKEKFGCGAIRYTDPIKKSIKRVAVCGGSGSFLLKDAIRAKADVFITSDFKYHEFFDADGQILIADIGHFESEQYTSEWIMTFLMKKFTTFAVRLTELSTNPINYL